jgi:selenocysteine lyase/cysteine desulfurase
MAELHDVEALRRTEFPLTEACAYLNHAGTGPLPRRHVRAAMGFLEACCAGKPPTTLAQSEQQLAALRCRAGRLMEAGAEEIAILSHTTQALALVPLALDWHEGDEVITYEKDYPSVVLSLMRLCKKGVQLRFLPDRGGRFELDDLTRLISPRTRLISLSMVNFVTGFRAPIEEVGRLCRERGIWLVVDAVQALGAIRVAARELGADILAAHGYKHLLCGYGVALCYCSPRAREALDITVPGWQGTLANADASAMLDHENVVFTGDARRFEPAVPNFAGLFGANESLQLLLDVGPAAIERRTFALLDDLAPELEGRGYRVVGSRRKKERSSLLTFACPPGVDSAALARDLDQRAVHCSRREGLIRVSPHFYNNSADIQRLLDCLPAAGGQG